MNLILDILSVISLFIFILSVFRSLEYSILIGILIKPLVDTSWDISLGGLRLIEFHSIVFLLLGYQLIIKNKLFANLDKSLVFFWMFSHVGVIFLFLFDPFHGIESLARLLFFPLALVLFPFFVHHIDIKFGRRLFKFLILGALFSSLISILQFIGIIPYEYAHLSKGLQRSNGFYHDMVTSRIYVIQGILSVAYIGISKKYELKKLHSLVFLFCFILAGYTLFSKALIGIFIFGTLLYILTIKQKISNIIFGTIIFVIFFIYNNETVSTTTQLFSKEIDYNEGEAGQDQLFSGRGGVWGHYLLLFEQANIVEKFLGLSSNDGRTHNEFLRFLILSGGIGLGFYILIYIRLFIISSIQIKRNGRFKFITLFCLINMLVDSISVVWGYYPFYVLLLIGFFSLSVLDEKKTNCKIKMTKPMQIW